MRASPERPFVSCIMPTRNRRAFLEQALRCFARQTHRASELIVIDDSDSPVEDLCAGLERVRYIRLGEPTPTGTKLNIGIAAAKGEIVQKLDDDDYYGPAFLETAVRRLARTRRSAIVAWDCFLVLMAGERRLRFSGHGWRTGGTLCFRRELWKRFPFRDIPAAVDHYFLCDTRAPVLTVCAPESYVVVRHGSHTWNSMSDGSTTDEYLGTLPFYRKPLARVIDARDVNFYRGLACTRAVSRAG